MWPYDRSSSGCLTSSDNIVEPLEPWQHTGVAEGGMLLEVVGSYHHGGGAQGVARAPEVVPLDAVELPDVVADGVVNAVQVGETTSVKPPT